MLRIVSIFIFIFIFGWSMLSAQDRGLYTQYFVNYELLNPAYSGFEGEHDVLFNYRNRWATFEGNPKNFTFAYNGRVADRIGLGAQIYNESIGSLNRFRAQLIYAYMFGNHDFDFSVGLSTEYERNSLDNEAITSPWYEGGDAIIETAANGLSFFNVSLGIHGTYGSDVFFGFVLPSMVRARLNDVSIPLVPEFDGEYFENFILYLGYNYFVSSGNFYLEPSIALKDVRNIDFHVDLNLKASFLGNRLIGGLSHSVGAGNRLGFLIGTNVNNVQIFYSYDASFLDFQDYNAGAHEFTLGIRLGQSREMDEVIDEKTDMQ